MENKFQIGDTVKIVNLDNPEGARWMGIIGHVGKIVHISNGDGRYSDITFYTLDPSCPGICWPALCLEMVKPSIREKRKKVKRTLFNMDDL